MTIHRAVPEEYDLIDPMIPAGIVVAKSTPSQKRRGGGLAGQLSGRTRRPRQALAPLRTAMWAAHLPRARLSGL